MNKRYSRTLFIGLAVLGLGLISTLPAGAALQVDISQGTKQAIPIAISPVGHSGGASLPVDIARVASEDLASTGLFKVVKRKNLVGTPTAPSQVNYANWRTAGVDNLVVGSAQDNGQGGYRITFHLLDATQNKSVASFQVNASRGALRNAAHTVANLIYQKFIGKKGYFRSRIAYITVTHAGGQGGRYRLVVSDYDGYNPKTVYTSPDPIMSPAWSPDGHKLAYVAFNVRRGRTSLRVQDLASGHVHTISSHPGINSAPAWSPDGSKLAFTLSYQGNPNIYIYNLNTHQLTQLTHDNAINTGATWSPDGQHIAFTSDRGGNPQIYQVSSSGGAAQRLTFSGKSNRRPEYSPDGQSLAMIQQSANGFRLALMDLKTSNIRVLSDGPLDDSPSFAPNGQVIIYDKQVPKDELATVSTNGSGHTQLTQSVSVREPAWGPFND